MAVVDIPPKLRAFADRSPAWADWVDRLPGLAADLLAEWGLRVDGPSLHGECALVVPVRTARGASRRAQGRAGPTRRRSTSTWPCASGAAVGRRFCSEPIHTDRPCCSSGCTPGT